MDNNSEKHIKKKENKEGKKKEVCIKAPEWAEHERFNDDDQPCDDGREGKI